jgi:hypothetical protein
MIHKPSDFETGPDSCTATSSCVGDAGIQGDQHKDDWQDDLAPKLTIERLLRGLDGKLVMAFGVVVPSLIFALFILMCMPRITLVCFDHPVETLAELLLVANIPIAIFIAWATLRKNNNGFSVVRGISLGSAIGASMIVCALSVCAAVTMSGSDMQAAVLFGWMSIWWLFAGAAGIFVVEKVRRTRDFSSSRARIVVMTGAGFALSLLTFAGSEAKPWCIRLAEHMAVSSSADEQRLGLKRLQSFYPEREMLIECTDARAAGLCGLFLPISVNSQRELYFAMTGEPFSFRDVNNKDLASISDESLARQVVGDQVAGLSLLRSSMTGVIHPETLSSSVSWTFVFKNDSARGQEARAEIAIPRGATVTRLTLWNKGEPQDAVFCDPSQLNYSNHASSSGSKVSSLITDLGHGRMLVSCAGIPAQNELKLRLIVVVPLKPDGSRTASLSMPRFIAANFDLSGEHHLRLRSPLAMTSALDNLKISPTAIGEKLITGRLTAKDLVSSDLMLSSAIPDFCGPVAARDTSSSRSGNVNDRPVYIQQSLVQIPARIPAQLVVVLDGSIKVEKYRSVLAESLKKLPANVPTSVILASSERAAQDEPITVAEAVAKLKANKCVGGQDNLKAMIKAAEVAGESRGGAVLWIHGPQPSSNREIYIMGQYDARPRFYDLPIESCDTDINEFFRNYSEIGPFEQVPRNGALASDIEHFFAKWKPGSTDYLVRLTRSSVLAPGTKVVLNRPSQELVGLWANQESLQYLAGGNNNIARKLGIDHRFVTRGCSAVLESKTIDVAESRVSVNDQFANAVGNEDSTVASINVATNEDGGAENRQVGGADATYITGVNCSGTVRVNNLSNLEAVLNIAANGVAIIGLSAGLLLFIHALLTNDGHDQPGASSESFHRRLGRGMKLALGCACIVGGLATPGCINWLVASARDANLFS